MMLFAKVLDQFLKKHHAKITVDRELEPKKAKGDDDSG